MQGNVVVVVARVSSSDVALLLVDVSVLQLFKAGRKGIAVRLLRKKRRVLVFDGFLPFLLLLLYVLLSVVLFYLVDVAENKNKLISKLRTNRTTKNGHDSHFFFQNQSRLTSMKHL